MAGRRLSPDEAALWARVMAGVRPMEGRAVKAGRPDDARHAGFVPASAVPKAPARARARDGGLRHEAGATERNVAPPRPQQGNTLDASWDRKLARGLAEPDRTIDLHGHTLDGAYRLLDAALDAAVRRGERVVLLVTGRPPRAGSERPHARGAIRAAVGDWLAGSRHAPAIGAVRAAHPRHGGAGALYIVLRRPR